MKENNYLILLEALADRLRELNIEILIKDHKIESLEKKIDLLEKLSITSTGQDKIEKRG